MATNSSVTERQNLLRKLVVRRDELTHTLAQPSLGGVMMAELARELAAIETLANLAERLDAVQTEREGISVLIADPNDEAMTELAEEESHRLLAEEHDLHAQLDELLLAEEDDNRNAILEIRAGTGGEEASLFARDLSRMYQRYAETKGWKFSIMSESETDRGGLREFIAEIAGIGAFRHMHLESGVHRVQRVPVTEANGRIHTSAATVAVLPEAKENEVEIEEADLRIDVYRASGPGGQSVNTTDSAVRITHLPSGLIVTQQDEKSQHRNKAKALKILRARLAEKERRENEAERAAARKGQIGSGDRSERIRTYNFPQGRVTDHRIGMTVHKLTAILNGEGLDEIVDTLLATERAEKLAMMKQG